MRPGKMIREVFCQFFKKAATTKYPAEALDMPDKYRGKLCFDASKCIGCKLCMKDCPTGAIVIKTAGDKQFEAEIDLGKCIYCAQCVDSCPKKALGITNNVELAQLDSKKLKVVLGANTQCAPGKTA